MDQIKNVLAAVQQGAAIHPSVLAQAMAELAKIEEILDTVDHPACTQAE